MTNLGKRHQISMALGLTPHSSFSHFEQATMAKKKAQMPIHISRPMTFMRVNPCMAALSLPAILP